MAEKIIASEIVNKVSIGISQKEINRLMHLKKTLDSLPKQFNIVANAQIKAAKQVERQTERARKSASNAASGQGNSRRYVNTEASIASRRIDFQRVLDARSMSDAQRSHKMTHFDELANQVKSGQMSLQQFNAELKKTKYEIQSTNPKVKSLSTEFRSMRHSIVAATASWTAFSGVMNITQTGQTFEGIRASMSMWSSDVADDFQYVTSFAQGLGAELESTAQGFTQLGVTAKGKLSKSDFRNLFEGFTEFSTIATGADKYRMERGLMAINQMLSKGQVYSEELRQQMGENIPGSIQIFANAIAGGDEKKLFQMVEDGKVIASEVMPKIAEEFKKAARNGGALDKVMKSNRAEMNRMSNNWKMLKDNFYSSGLNQAMTYLYKTLNRLMEGIQPLIPAFGRFFRVFSASFMLPFDMFADLLKSMSEYIPVLSTETSRWVVALVGAAAGFAAITKTVLLLRSALLALAAASGIVKLLTGGGPSTGTKPSGGIFKKLGGWGLGALGALGTAAKTPLGAAAIGTTAGAGAITAGAISLDQNMRRSMWEGTLNRYNSSDMRPANGKWGATTDVNVKVNEGNLKGLIEVEVVKHNKNNLNEIIMNTPD